MDKKKRILRIAAVGVGVLAVALITAYSSYMLWEEAPVVETPQPTLTPAAESIVPAPEESALPLANDRKPGVYTMLLVGNDDGNGNTDTIMLGKIDTVEHKMDFVSIPRDTLINVDWEVRKINAAYWADKNHGGNGIGALKSHVRKLCGFDVDCYAVIDLDIFIDTVDALGGVYFDVPQVLSYVDAGQDLYIDLQPGYQHLDGYQAMGLCRYRSGYVDGDVGRINMQHEFLKACAGQFISLGNIPNISDVVDILSSGLHTDMSAANIAFFIRQALLCDSEDISFYTVPTTPATVHGYSYALVDVSDWLQLLNEHLNPYETDVGWGNVDIVYLSGGNFYGTAPLNGSWYYEKPRPAPAATPAPLPAETPAPATPALPALPEFTFPPVNTPKPTMQTEDKLLA